MRAQVLFTYSTTNNHYRLDVLKLLQGDVYEEREPAVLGDLTSYAIRLQF